MEPYFYLLDKGLTFEVWTSQQKMQTYSKSIFSLLAMMAADGLCHFTSPPFSQYKFTSVSSVNNTTTTSQYDMKKFIKKKKTELLFNNLT